MMTQRQLTPDEEEHVQMNLTEYFVFTQDEIGEELGLKRQSDGNWSQEDADRIFAEVVRLKRQDFIDYISPTTA